jgi:hypothetical protein
VDQKIDASDIKLVVRQRGATQAKSWRWDIYRTGRSTPLVKSKEEFASRTEATRAGQRALYDYLQSAVA